MKLKVGDQVKYTDKFLKSIHAYTDELPRTKGKIVFLGRLKPGYEKYQTARVKWDDGTLSHILSTNICKAKVRSK